MTEENNTSNKYGLLEQDKDAEEEIDRAIRNFQNRIYRIKNKYPDSGVGDTATDEKITEELYKAIHKPVEEIREDLENAPAADEPFAVKKFSDLYNMMQRHNNVSGVKSIIKGNNGEEDEETEHNIQFRGFKLLFTSEDESFLMFPTVTDEEFEEEDFE